MRLHQDTPARQALTEALRPSKRPVGRLRTIWLNCVLKDLENADIHPELDDPEILKKLEQLTQDRHEWRHTVRSSMGEILLEE